MVVRFSECPNQNSRVTMFNIQFRVLNEMNVEYKYMYSKCIIHFRSIDWILLMVPMVQQTELPIGSAGC